MESDKTIKIALAGNPNVGKSTLFNYFTGLKQHTGNWTGKTVGTAARRIRRQPDTLLADIPGTYSLAARSAEEQHARRRYFQENEGKEGPDEPAFLFDDFDRFQPELPEFRPRKRKKIRLFPQCYNVCTISQPEPEERPQSLRVEMAVLAPLPPAVNSPYVLVNAAGILLSVINLFSFPACPQASTVRRLWLPVTVKDRDKKGRNEMLRAVVDVDCAGHRYFTSS